MTPERENDSAEVRNPYPPGAWVVYDYDHGPYAIALHGSAEAAARTAARQGYGRVGFWPFGTEFRGAIEQWEGR